MRGRSQRAESRDQVLRIIEAAQCSGCDRPCGDRKYCAKCAEEIASLEALWEASAMTRAEKLAAARQDRLTGMTTPALEGFRAIEWVREWLWVPALVFVGGTALYVGWQMGAAVIEWIRAGGWQ